MVWLSNTVGFWNLRPMPSSAMCVSSSRVKSVTPSNSTVPSSGLVLPVMMDIITGKTKPDEGTVLFDGVTDLTRLDETHIAELGIGRKFQKPTVFESQTIEDNLLLALNVDHRVKGTLFWRESKAETERIERVLETIRLTDARDRLAGSL